MRTACRSTIDIWKVNSLCKYYLTYEDKCNVNVDTDSRERARASFVNIMSWQTFLTSRLLIRRRSMSFRPQRICFHRLERAILPRGRRRPWSVCHRIPPYVCRWVPPCTSPSRELGCPYRPLGSLFGCRLRPSPVRTDSVPVKR
jgi:hypothetical protein